MSTCPFYKEEVKRIRSQELRNDGQAAPVQVIRTSWCEHKHTPVLEIAAKGLGGGNLLKCNGSYANCSVPSENRGDV